MILNRCEKTIAFLFLADVPNLNLEVDESNYSQQLRPATELIVQMVAAYEGSSLIKQYTAPPPSKKRNMGLNVQKSCCKIFAYEAQM